MNKKKSVIQTSESWITLCAFLLFAGCVQLATASNSELSLTHNSETEYEIILCENAIPAEKTAAAELGKYLKAIAKTEFKIVPEKKRDGAPKKHNI